MVLWSVRNSHLFPAIDQSLLHGWDAFFLLDTFLYAGYLRDWEKGIVLAKVWLLLMVDMGLVLRWGAMRVYVWVGWAGKVERGVWVCVYLVFRLDVKLDLFARQGADSREPPLLACGVEEGRRGVRPYLIFMMAVLGRWWSG